MEYEFKIGQCFKNNHSLSLYDNLFQIINMFEYDGVKYLTYRYYNRGRKKYNISVCPDVEFREGFNFGMEEVKEFEYICPTCGQITKRENDVDAITKCDNCGGQAMLKR